MVVQRGSLSRIRLCDFSPGPLARHVRRTGPLSWRAFFILHAIRRHGERQFH